MSDENPKTKFGKAKPSLENVPIIPIYVLAQAMDDGAVKYGRLNYREKEVPAMIYVEAAKRHLHAWQDHAEHAPDSGVHHLGHVMACCAILLDAQAQNCLIDDRPEQPLLEVADWLAANTAPVAK